MGDGWENLAKGSTALVAHLESRRGAMVDSILELVAHESPSGDKPALDALADRLTRRYEGCGARVERMVNVAGGDHLRVVWGEGPEPPILVLCHFDTVWPVGTLALMPIGVEGDRAHGPGIYDMKTSLVMIQAAIGALAAMGTRPCRQVVLLATSDEEIGSPTSRLLIEEEAKRSACTLVLEPPLADGRLKTSRKGIGQYTLRTRGRPAHAGVEPEKGASAILEIAHQILGVMALAKPELGTTLNVGKVSGGTAANVIAAEATATIDLRASTLDEAARVDAALRALKPVGRGTHVEISGGLNRPPMERTKGNLVLYEQARVFGRQLGLTLGEGGTGGGSDGNFTSAVGCPTLDGLGCEGLGAHAPEEQIQIESLVPRTALLTLLLAGLFPDGAS